MSKNYSVPLLVSVVGMVLCAAALGAFLQAFGGWSTSLQGPGSVTVTIPTAGDFRLWHESKTSIAGRLHMVDDELPAGSVIEFIDARGRVIALRSTQAKLSQEIGNTRRVAIGHIEVSEPGSYTVTITGFDAPRMFHLSEIRFLEHFLRALLIGLPAIALTMVGLIWMVVVAARRGRSLS